MILALRIVRGVFLFLVALQVIHLVGGAVDAAQATVLPPRWIFTMGLKAVVALVLAGAALLLHRLINRLRAKQGAPPLRPLTL